LSDELSILGRRGLLRAAPVLLTGSAARAFGAPSPDTTPQSGDQLVFETGDRKWKPIDASDLQPSQQPLLAQIMDVANGALRNASRFGQVLLVRPDPERLKGAGSVVFAAGGVLGFSAICTHAACVVSGWRPAEGLLFCPCHGSVYDPAAGGRVVAGPAPRPLPRLPLKLAGDGSLAVAGGFTAHVGASTGRTD
jgi:rieske iron-sulfur protein